MPESDRKAALLAKLAAKKQQRQERLASPSPEGRATGSESESLNDAVATAPSTSETWSPRTFSEPTPSSNGTNDVMSPLMQTSSYHGDASNLVSRVSASDTPRIDPADMVEEELEGGTVMPLAETGMVSPSSILSSSPMSPPPGPPPRYSDSAQSQAQAVYDSERSSNLSTSFVPGLSDSSNAASGLGATPGSASRRRRPSYVEEPPAVVSRDDAPTGLSGLPTTVHEAAETAHNNFLDNSGSETNSGGIEERLSRSRTPKHATASGANRAGPKATSFSYANRKRTQYQNAPMSPSEPQTPSRGTGTAASATIDLAAGHTPGQRPRSVSRSRDRSSSSANAEPRWRHASPLPGTDRRGSARHERLKKDFDILQKRLTQYTRGVTTVTLFSLAQNGVCDQKTIAVISSALAIIAAIARPNSLKDAEALLCEKGLRSRLTNAPVGELPYQHGVVLHQLATRLSKSTKAGAMTDAVARVVNYIEAFDNVEVFCRKHSFHPSGCGSSQLEGMEPTNASNDASAAVTTTKALPRDAVATSLNETPNLNRSSQSSTAPSVTPMQSTTSKGRDVSLSPSISQTASSSSRRARAPHFGEILNSPFKAKSWIGIDDSEEIDTSNNVLEENRRHSSGTTTGSALGTSNSSTNDEIANPMRRLEVLLLARVQDLEDQVKSLTSKLSLSQSHVSTLKAERDERVGRSKRNAFSTVPGSELALDDVSLSQAMKQDLEDKLKRTSAANRDLRAEVEASEIALAEMQKRVRSSEGQVEVMAGRMRDMERVRDLSIAQGKELTTLHARMQELTEERNKNTKQIATLLQNIEELEKVRDQADALRKENRSLRANQATSQAGPTASNVGATDPGVTVTPSLQNTIATLMARQGDLEAQVAAYESDTMVKDMLAKHLKEKTELQEQLEILTEENKNLKTAVREAESRRRSSSISVASPESIPEESPSESNTGTRTAKSKKTTKSRRASTAKPFDVDKLDKLIKELVVAALSGSIEQGFATQLTQTMNVDKATVREAENRLSAALADLDEGVDEVRVCSSEVTFKHRKGIVNLLPQLDVAALSRLF